MSLLKVSKTQCPKCINFYGFKGRLPICKRKVTIIKCENEKPKCKDFKSKL